MTLTEDDKQQLRALLDNNREGKCDSDHIVDLGPVTDDTTFVARHGSYNSKIRYHKNSNGEPACGATSKRPFSTWQKDEARAWLRAYADCFPNGDPGGDA